MAQVYLAVGEFGEVAIKVLDARFAEDPDEVQRFKFESEAIRRLRHDHIVRVYARGVAQGRHYTVMEVLPGGNLADRLRQGPFAPNRAAEMVSAIASALAYAHRKRVIHRDVKPSNILFTEDDEAVLTDFGIAKSLTVESVAGRDVRGTIPYMAPEQIQGRATSDKTDVYALGLTFFDALVGDAAPQGARSLELIALDQLQGEASAYRDLIARCLWSDPRQRPSAREVAQSIEKITSGSGAPYAWAKLATWGLGLALLASVATFYPWKSQEPPTTSPSAADDPSATTAPPDIPGTRSVSLYNEAPQTRVYVDGVLTKDNPVKLENDSELLIVAPGTLGRIVDGSSIRTSDFDARLPELGLPSFDELVRFQKRATSTDALIPEDLDGITHAPFRDALTFRLATQGSDNVLANDMLARQRKLAGAQDQAATMFLYLVSGMELIPDSVPTLARALAAAGDQGYALASLFYASHVLTIERGPTATSRRYFESAIAQGLPRELVQQFESATN